MAEVKVNVSPEFFQDGEVRVNVKVSIPTELLCLKSQTTVLGESLHPNWGYWGGTSSQGDTPPFRYKEKAVSPDRVSGIIQALKDYAKDVREQQSKLDKTGKVYILDL